MTGETRCDFCHAARPKWVVPANSFDAVPGVVRSVDDWYACTVCARFVRAGEWDKLLSRTRDSWKRVHGRPMHPVAVETLRLTYEKLSSNIRGPVRKV